MTCMPYAYAPTPLSPKPLTPTPPSLLILQASHKALNMSRVPIEDRFWMKVDKNGPIHTRLKTRCWIWVGGKSNGYGKIKLSGRMVGVHRLSWKIHNRPISNSGLFVLHECDVRHCVNPDHLFLGTHQDNMDDKVNKGRQSRLRGEKNPEAKLSDSEVQEIRTLYEDGFLQREIAKFYEVSQQAVSLIVTRMFWKHA